MLPFLKPKQWPRIAKPLVGESRYGFSEDDDLIEQALDELCRAMATKNASQLVSAITALVECIRSREESRGDNAGL